MPLFISDINIELLILYLILGFITSTIGLCFHHFMLPDMIFNKYARWLLKMSDKSNFWNTITKPLGLCPYCNTTWIGIFVYIWFFGLSLHIFLFIGVTWFFVHLIMIKLNIH